VQLGTLLLQGEEIPLERVTEAVELFGRAAAAGNVDGDYNLGVCYRRGLGLAVDTDRAQQLYRAAAIRGHRSAQLALADLLTEAGDDASLKEAVRWYEQASNAGMPGAMYGLATLYEAGKGVPESKERAIQLNTRAADAGHAAARQALARLIGTQPAA
jgi:TPR repeat protein